MLDSKFPSRLNWYNRLLKIVCNVIYAFIELDAVGHIDADTMPAVFKGVACQ